MKLAFLSGNKTCVCCKYLTQGILIGGLLVVNTTGIFKDHSVDGIARATPTTAPPPVKLKLSSTPKRNNSGVINITEGQTLAIHLKATNSNDPKGLDTLKLHSLSVDLDSSTAPLPEAEYVNTCADNSGGTCGDGTFTWTPKLGDAEKYYGKLLTFIATNSYTSATTKQQVILRVQDNASPAFSDTLPNTLTATSGVLQKLDIFATPGMDNNGKPHKLNIVRDADTPLPRGAKLGKARLAADGNWHSILSWKPKANQQGLSGSLRIYADNADVYSAATFSQAEYVLDYSVAAATPLPSNTPSVSGVSISDAAATGAGASWTLTVHGQVQSTDTLPTGLRVKLKFGDGTTAISADNSNAAGAILINQATGAWSYTGTIDPNYAAQSGYRNLPCNVIAQVTYNGVTVDSGLVAVTGVGDAASNQCVNTAMCGSGKKWYIYNGSMAAMCM